MKKLFLKYKEAFLYLFWGAVTTLVNYVVYFLCTDLFLLNYLLSNVLAWIVSVIVAFLSNKALVFRSLSWNKATLFREIWKFLSARLFSVVLEMALLYVFVDLLLFNDGIVKIAAGMLVVLLNYVFSKLFIFKSK